MKKTKKPNLKQSLARATSSSLRLGEQKRKKMLPRKRTLARRLGAKEEEEEEEEKGGEEEICCQLNRKCLRYVGCSRSHLIDNRSLLISNGSLLTSDSDSYLPQPSTRAASHPALVDTDERARALQKSPRGFREGYGEPALSGVGIRV
jgi:hypothetical protein